MPPNPFKKCVSYRHWVKLLEKEALTSCDIIFVKGVLGSPSCILALFWAQKI